ncbi:MAG: hypothetical protein NT091_04295, partial [Candidatus Falkowbacteria bacterium]|nr:hypothetical protein [Candidatus Falkowbacteria bacterium]
MEKSIQFNPEQINQAQLIKTQIKQIQAERSLEDLSVNDLRQILELYKEIKSIANETPTTPKLEGTVS